MRNSISTKIFMGYAAVLLITIGAAFAITNSNVSVQQRVTEFMQETLPQLHSLEQITEAISQLEIAAYSLYGTTTEVAQFDRQHKQQTTQFEEAAQLLRTSQSELALEPLESSWASYSQSLDELRNVMTEESIDWDSARDALSQLSKNSTLIHAEISTLQSTVSSQATQSSQMISEAMSTALQMIIALVTLSVLVAVLSYAFSRSQIAGPIHLLSTELARVRENCDLTIELPEKSSDEVGQTAKSMNQLIGVFRSGMSEVLTAIDGISQSVNSLGITTSNSDNSVNQLNKEIDALMDVMSELERKIENGTQQSQNASNTAQRGASEVKKGATEVEQTSTSIAMLANDIEKTAEMLLALRTSGDKVSSVVGTIAEIADQTNLLALNAAIEAARAGESGRGFAVVADEVRTLANRTHQSTVEINSMLESIVTSITAAVDNMESNQKKARESVHLSENTVESLSAIRETILCLSNECAEAASLADSSQDNAVSVRKQIDHFKALGEAVAGGSQETQNASVSLTDAATSLGALVSRFKV